MEIKVSKKYLKIAPRKTRLLADLIRRSPVNDGLARLSLIAKGAADPIAKLIKSAKTIAIDKEMKEDKLYIKSIQVDQGPALKRRYYRARGRASMIKKRMSHIELVVSEKTDK